jgi:hypothetical protein
VHLILANPPWHQLRERAEKIPGDKKHAKEFSHRVIVLRSSILYRSRARSIVQGEERGFRVARPLPFGLCTKLELPEWPSLRPCIQNLGLQYIIGNHYRAQVERTAVSCTFRVSEKDERDLKDLGPYSARVAPLGYKQRLRLRMDQSFRL